MLLPCELLKSDLTDTQFGDILKARGNPYHDDKGRFTSSGGVGGKMGNVSLPLKPPKICAKERARLTHQFLTDHPDAKIGVTVTYENRNHFFHFF